MKKLIIILLTIPLLFSNCQEDEDPTTISVNYITACNEAEYDLTINGTNFWDSDNGVWYSIDGTYHYCRKYLDTTTTSGGNIDGEPTNLTDFEIRYNQNGTQDLLLNFKPTNDPNDIWFNLQFGVMDLLNFPINQAVNYNTVGSPTGTAIFGFSLNEYIYNPSLILTTKDIQNGIYEGIVSCSFIDWEDVFLTPPPIQYTSTINFHFDM